MPRVCDLQEMAEAEGEMEKAENLRLELEDLEDRAKELDSRRTSTISAIRLAFSCSDSLCCYYYYYFLYLQ